MTRRHTFFVTLLSLFLWSERLGTNGFYVLSYFLRHLLSGKFEEAFIKKSIKFWIYCLFLLTLTLWFRDPNSFTPKLPSKWLSNRHVGDGDLVG